MGRLAEAAGSIVTVAGRVRAEPTLSPVTWHPCAAWWCWIDRAPSPEGWVAVGAAAHGAFVVEDGSGTLRLDAAECRLPHPPSAGLVVARDQWPPPGSSRFHDALRDLCRAAGLARPEDAPFVRARESLLPLDVEIEARGLVVLDPGERPAGYRGEPGGEASLRPPPGGLIELSAR